MRSKSGSPDIQGELGYLVGSLASAMRIGLDRELASFNVSSAQWAILEACHEGEASTLTSLSRVIPIDTASISRQVERLVRAGLVQRRRSTRDRRLVRLSLTVAGRRLVPELAERVQANNARFLAGIATDEQEAMLRTIRRMLENAQAEVYDGNS
ncbi:MAG: MarR family transcriptional regulator [Chloroflexi bacterium]|nr:MarR family transcriptional regulator [Chloroflexota bacterium]MCY3959351.1 MarR family transcriptional regulator [Chloroflexota bacterium]